MWDCLIFLTFHAEVKVYQGIPVYSFNTFDSTTARKELKKTTKCEALTTSNIKRSIPNIVYGACMKTYPYINQINYCIMILAISKLCFVSGFPFQLDPHNSHPPNLAPLRSWGSQLATTKKAAGNPRSPKFQMSLGRVIPQELEVDWEITHLRSSKDTLKDMICVVLKGKQLGENACLTWRPQKCWSPPPKKKTLPISPKKTSSTKSLEVLGKAEIGQLNMTSPW